MMSLSEKQVCSLEYSRELEKLGVRQNSIFYWRKYSLCKNTDLYYIPNKELDLLVLSGQLEYNFSAFTVAELGEMLPSKYIKEIEKVKTDWYFPEKYDVIGNLQFTEANARAKMLIYLLENKIIIL